MKKMFISPDFELIRIGLVADVTTNSQTEEETVFIDGEIVPPTESGGGFEEWEEF